MFNKAFQYLIVSIFLIIAFTNSSDAFFFKKKPIDKKEFSQSTISGVKKEVILAEIYASWCPGCKNIQPTIDQLIKDSPEINFVQLDVSTPSKAEESREKAKDLMILDFYNVNKSKTATVAVIAPTSGEIVSVFENDNDLDGYKAAIENAKTKEKALQNPPA